jgi:hypothetical protein
MMRKLITIGATLVVGAVLSCSGFQSKEETYIGKEVLELPKGYSLSQIVQKSQEVVSESADEVKKVVGVVPDKLPPEPGEPKVSVSPVKVECPDAAATVSAVKYPSDFDFVETTGVNYKVCIYPYTEGYRVYLIGAYTRYIPNKVGQAISSVGKIFSGGDCDNMTDLDCSWQKVVDKTKETFPDAKIVEIKYPTGLKKGD